MTDIFREVEEDVRQEQLTEFLKAHWIKIAGVMAALIVAYGAYNYMQDSNRADMSASSNALEAAVIKLDTNDAAGAAAEFAAIRDARGLEDYGLLATFREAEAMQAQGKTDAAVRLYEDIAVADGVDGFIADMATYYAGSALIAGGKAEAGISKLDALAASNSPLKSLALELKGYSLYSAGKLDEARDIFTELQAIAPVDTTLGGRVAQMLSELGAAEEQNTAE